MHEKEFKHGANALLIALFLATISRLSALTTTQSLIATGLAGIVLGFALALFYTSYKIGSDNILVLVYIAGNPKGTAVYSKKHKTLVQAKDVSGPNVINLLANHNGEKVTIRNVSKNFTSKGLLFWDSSRETLFIV